MEEIKYQNLKNALVEVTNSGNLNRVYDIKADVYVRTESKLGTVENGSIKNVNEDLVLATFNSWSDINISYHFQQDCDKSNIINEIDMFLKHVNEKLLSDPLLLN